MRTFLVKSTAPKKLSILVSLIVSAFITACNPEGDAVTPQTEVSQVANPNASAKVELSALDSNSTLKSVATFPIGISLDAKLIDSNTKVSHTVTNEFNSRTVKIFMNMQAAPGKFNFTEMDARINTTKGQAIRLHGHCLVYHIAAPDWFNNFSGNTAGFEAAVKNHIQTIVGRYKGQVKSWDVINEIFDYKGGLKKTAFRNLYNSDADYMAFVKRCFLWAKEADPTTVLIYNDFGYENNPGKLQAVLQMVSDFKKSGTPIDGIGTQTHIDINTSESGIRNAFLQLAATGLMVHVSELDIVVNPKNDPAMIFTKKILDQQAAKYQTVATLYKQNVPARLQYGITLWDFSDADSWLVVYKNMHDIPTVHNEQYGKKVAYYGLSAGLR